MELVREGERIVLYVDELLLMTSLASGSEIAMAEVACRELGPGARVLVGGLGLGYTLRAVLDVVAPDTEVVCAELLEALVGWHREGPLGAAVGDAVRDARVRVEVGDVAKHALEGPPEHFDAILLDVDNGPVPMTQGANGRLYTAEGLSVLHDRLRPGGALVVWSAEDFPRFTERLKATGFETETLRVAAGPSPESEGIEHVLFVGRRRP